MNLNMILRVLWSLLILDIPELVADSMSTLQFKQMMNLTGC